MDLIGTLHYDEVGKYKEIGAEITGYLYTKDERKEIQITEVSCLQRNVTEIA